MSGNRENHTRLNVVYIDLLLDYAGELGLSPQKIHESIKERFDKIKEQSPDFGICEWKEDSRDARTYDTQCGGYFTFFDVKSPEDMNMGYCCYCGKNIKEIH